MFHISVSIFLDPADLGRELSPQCSGAQAVLKACCSRLLIGRARFRIGFKVIVPVCHNRWCGSELWWIKREMAR
jgi:hypothetical protein